MAMICFYSDDKTFGRYTQLPDTRKKEIKEKIKDLYVQEVKKDEV